MPPQNNRYQPNRPVYRPRQMDFSRRPAVWPSAPINQNTTQQNAPPTVAPQPVHRPLSSPNSQSSSPPQGNAALNIQPPVYKQQMDMNFRPPAPNNQIQQPDPIAYRQFAPSSSPPPRQQYSPPVNRVSQLNTSTPQSVSLPNATQSLPPDQRVESSTTLEKISSPQNTSISNSPQLQSRTFTPPTPTQSRNSHNFLIKLISVTQGISPMLKTLQLKYGTTKLTIAGGSIVAVLAAVILLLPPSSPFNDQFTKSAAMALYYPTNIPSGYSIDKNSIQKTGNQSIQFNLVHEKNIITIAESQPGSAINNVESVVTSKLNPSENITTKYGTAIVGAVNTKNGSGLAGTMSTRDGDLIIATANNFNLNSSSMASLFSGLRKQ